MILKGFRSRLSDYGYRRLATSRDFTLAIGITIAVAVLQVVTCDTSFLGGVSCYNAASETFVNESTSIAVSLIAFIIAGLSIIISFSDREFLAELSDSGVYNILLFIFEYSILLSIATSVTGVLIRSYNLGAIPFFLVFVLIFASHVFNSRTGTDDS